MPTPGKIWWDGIVKATPIRWDNPDRAPLLLIGGELDLIADASMTQAIYEKQKQAPSLTELKIFPGRSHWTLLDPGWEEVADYALDWAVRNARPAKAKAEATAEARRAELAPLTSRRPDATRRVCRPRRPQHSQYRRDAALLL